MKDAWIPPCIYIDLNIKAAGFNLADSSQFVHVTRHGLDVVTRILRNDIEC